MTPETQADFRARMRHIKVAKELRDMAFWFEANNSPANAKLCRIAARMVEKAVEK